MTNVKNYTKCNVIRQTEETNPYDVTINYIEDADDNFVSVEQDAQIELLNLHPESRNALREAEEGEDMELLIDNAWLESEGII